MQSLMNISVSALGAFGEGMHTIANNLANMNTPGFKAQRADYETGPNGQGVGVGIIQTDYSDGPLIADIPPQRPGDMPGVREGSNVSIEREFVNMISTEHAYSANAAVIRSYEDSSGVILNLIA